MAHFSPGVEINNDLEKNSVLRQFRTNSFLPDVLLKRNTP